MPVAAMPEPVSDDAPPLAKDDIDTLRRLSQEAKERAARIGINGMEASEFLRKIEKQHAEALRRHGTGPDQ